MDTKGRKLFRCAAGVMTAAVLMGNAHGATVMASGIGQIDTAGLLNIHAEASDSSEVLGQVMNKGHVAILDRAGSWVQIQAGEIIGWAPQANLVETDISAEEACEANRQVIAEIAGEMSAVPDEQGQRQEAAAVSAEDVELLASIIYCEANGEPYVGKVAVGNVVMNRVKSDEYPGTIKEVIYAKGQFTPVRNGSMARALQNDSADASCYQAAMEALAGSSPVDGKLYFRRVNGRPGQIIGNHVFY